VVAKPLHHRPLSEGVVVLVNVGGNPMIRGVGIKGGNGPDNPAVVRDDPTQGGHTSDGMLAPIPPGRI